MSLNFVSEDTLEAKRKQRQEEWEKVRTAEDPVEAPEEEVDDRSLYHRLQEQKMAKEAEKTEEHKLRNMVQGLKKDETDFLDFVATKQMQHNREKEKEEENLLKEIEEARGKLDEESSSSSSSSLSAKSKATSGASKSAIVGASKRTNQSALLAGVVVKKKPRTSSSGESEAERNGKTSSSPPPPPSLPPLNPSGRGNDADDGADDDSKDVEGTGVAKVIGVLPGIGEYTDSSESDSEHEEETISTKHLGFMKLKKKQKKNGGGE